MFKLEPHTLQDNFLIVILETIENQFHEHSLSVESFIILISFLAA